MYLFLYLFMYLFIYSFFYLFIYFYFDVLLIILVLFFRKLWHNFFYKKNLIKTKYFLFKKHGPCVSFLSSNSCRLTNGTHTLYMYEVKNISRDSCNLICVVICDTCKEEYFGETRGGKTKLKHRVRVYWQHIWQQRYQQLKVEGHLRSCANGGFWIFPLLEIHSQDTNLRRSYKTEVPAKIQNKTK